MTIQRSRPIVDQINDNLRQRIYDETYPPGSRLPSESELLHEFGVSRATVRTALTRLAAEGLIIRRQGDGTYVNEHLQDVNAQMGGLWEYMRLIQRSGYTPSIRLLEAAERAATPAEKEALGAAQGERVLLLKRLFFADERPVITTANAIPRRILGNAGVEIDGAMPLPQLLHIHCNESIAYAIFDIRAALADEAIAALLQREPGDPLLKINTTFYNADNQPLVHGTSYYDDAYLNLRLIQTWS